MIRLLMKLSFTLLLTQYVQFGLGESFGGDVSSILDKMAPVIKIQEYLDRNTQSLRDDHPALIVSTEYGRVRGRPNLTVRERFLEIFGRDKFIASHPRVFAGIPFAAPPVGNLRFEPPAPFNDTWGGIDASGKPYGAIRDAISYPNDCPQHFLSLGRSEDCLYLNIFVPPADKIAADKPLPVLFYVFGGAFAFGGSYSFDFYNGRFLTEHKDVIVVTSNHRTNAFGFFTTDEVRGNAAIEDQRAAMLWVKRNIRAFGGDPDNITLFGFSSGATSVGIHLTSPRTPPNLFKNAIMQSNPFGIRMRSKEQIRASSVELAELVGCKNSDGKVDMACMRSKPWNTIIDAMGHAPDGKQVGTSPLSDPFAWWASIDGYNVVENPRTAFQNGHFNKNVPVILGNTQDELGFWVLQMLYKPGSPGAAKLFGLNGYEKQMETIFKNTTAEVRNQYPIDVDVNKNIDSYIRLGTDYEFLCPSDDVAKAITRHGGQAYVYYFSQAGIFPPIGVCRGRTCHSVDLTYTWRAPFYFFMSKKQERLSDHWISYYTNFATTGNPNKGPSIEVDMEDPEFKSLLPTWPAYSINEPLYQHLADTVQPISPPHQKSCAFWNQVGYRF
ncbi:Carboxylesterase [Syncephalis fuscata]|nr:Carboxylesterase [Syncephalis fuscata]